MDEIKIKVLNAKITERDHLLEKFKRYSYILRGDVRTLDNGVTIHDILLYSYGREGDVLINGKDVEVEDLSAMANSIMKRLESRITKVVAEIEQLKLNLC